MSVENRSHIVNTFEEGLDWDSHISLSNNKRYRYAQNIIDNDRDQINFKSNEHSFRKLPKYPARIVGTGRIGKINSTVILLQNGEIHLYNHKTEESQFVAADSEFGCDWGFINCEWVEVSSYDQYICDIWITYSSAKVFYNLNLSELLNPERKQGLLNSINCGSGCSNRTCDYFKVFKKACDPHISAMVMSGGSLRNGTYFISGRYTNNQGGYSNPFPLSPAIHIGSNDNITGEISNKRIEITIQNATCAFDQIELFIHELPANVVRALPATYISGNNFTMQFTGSEGNTINEAELFTNRRTYIEGEDLTLYDNRAFYYRTTPEFEYNFQPIANGIEVNWLAVKVPLEDVKKYNLKSFKRNETYAFSFTPSYISGRRGYGFHIPGLPDPGGTCNASISGDRSEPTARVGSILNRERPYESLKNPQQLVNVEFSTQSSSPNSNTVNESGSAGGQGTSSPNISTGLLYKRVRSKLPSTVNRPHEDKFTDLGESIIESWIGDIDDICKAIEAGCDDLSDVAINEDGSLNCDCGDAIDAYCEVERRKQQAAICRQNASKAEEIGASWFNAVSEYISEEQATGNKPVWTESDNNIVGMSPADILNNPATAIPKFKQAAKNIVQAVKNRERKFFDYNPHKFTKSSSYTNDSLDANNDNRQRFVNSITSSIGSPNITKLYDHILIGSETPPPVEYQSDFEIEIEDGIYMKYPVIAKGKTIPKFERSKYPCNTDCEGNPIYCTKAGQNISHHTMPGHDIISHWIPKSSGDGSTFQNDADIMDGYAILLWPEFTNIVIPEEVQSKLCPVSPFNIGVVKRDSRNSSIILSGVGSEGFVSTNQGKPYLYEKIGGNSFERCSKHIDIDGVRMDPGAGTDPNNIFIHSLDQLCKEPFLNGTHLRRVGSITGTGARHFMYVKGLEPTDNRASREDQSGSVHTIIMGEFTPANDRFEIESQIYATPNSVVSPPAGNDTPFMNKHGQGCAWISATGASRDINDNSFVGDVLQYKAPITYTELDYFEVEREMEDQYGDIASLNYVTLTQARGFQSTVRANTGDIYIGPYSYVKTHYVSDRVGNYFPVGNMVAGKSDRCICDDPEDAIHSLVGSWFWTKLPIEGDAANAKNWAGLHTTDVSRTWDESVAIGQTESHYYFPKTTKHMISYVGEFDVNPWLREKGDALEEQWYPEIKPIYSLHSSEHEGGDWKIGFLNLFYALREQPGSMKLALKVVILSFINAALPLLGIEDWTNAETGVEFAGDMVGAVMQIAVWLLLSQVLFDNEFVDRFLGLPLCKKDEDGGEDAVIEKWFTMNSNYDYVYSIDYSFPTIIGLPNTYTGCYCTDKTMNNVYVSDFNSTDSYINGYQIVRPNSVLTIDETQGKLSKIYVIADTIYFHTTEGVYGSKMGQVQIPTSIGQAITGDTNFISTPKLITTSSQEGQFGLAHPNHGKLTGFGFVFVDENSNNLLIFNGAEFDILSSEKYKMYTFFNKHLRFCTWNGCTFEQLEGTNYYSFGIDYKLGRLLFTKSDGDYSYTMSFNLKRKYWVSFHTVTPQEYLLDRYDLLILQDDTIWIHDDYETCGNYCGDQQDCYIDFVAAQDGSTFQYMHTEINTEAKVGNKRARNVTFDEVSIINSWQTTGALQLEVSTKKDYSANIVPEKTKDRTSKIEVKRVDHTFRFNEVHDYTIDHEGDIIIEDPCIVKPKLINAPDYSDRSEQSYSNRVVSDNYLYYRFKFTNFDGIKLYIKNIITYVTRRPA